MIDDNQADLDLSEMAFEEVGLRVRFLGIRDPEAAVRRLRGIATQPDEVVPRLVLLDLNMPRIFGSEIVELMRAVPRLREIPVVVLTTSNSPDDRTRCLALGATDFQVKPHRLDAYLALFKSFARYVDGSGEPPAPASPDAPNGADGLPGAAVPAPPRHERLSEGVARLLLPSGFARLDPPRA